MEMVKTHADSSQPFALCSKNVKHLDLIFKSYLEDVVGYCGTIAFYKYLAFMSIQKKTF